MDLRDWVQWEFFIKDAPLSFSKSIKIKRVFDVTVAFLGLVGCGLPIGLALIFSRLDTGKSGLFKQTRIGKDGQQFEIAKIRTMRDVPYLSTTTTVKNDPRVTRLGKWLRSTKIDELPQLWNVLCGSMSLVGPRPTTISDYERMNIQQRQRNSVRPGMTGLAQISGNTSLSWPERIELDLEYVASTDRWIDIKILAKTIGLLVTGRAVTESPTTDEWSKAA